MTTTATTTSDSPIQDNGDSSENVKNDVNVKNEKNTSSANNSSSTDIIVTNNNNNNASCNINDGASERRYRPLKFCSVCGDKAIACNFNAVTCESCKAFFRRNAFKETRLKCLFDNRCVIDRVTRRFCSKCRLLKCFQIGMKREWILTDEQKQIKRVKIMQNKQSRSQKASTSPSQSEGSASPKLANSSNNLRITSPVVEAGDLATTASVDQSTTNTTRIGAIQSPTRSHNNSKSEDSNFLELVNSPRSQVFESNEKELKISSRNTRLKQSKVVETRDASTSCPDEFDLLNPHTRAHQHCSFVSQCQYCSLRLFGTSTPTTVSMTGGQHMFVDYHQHLHHQLSHHHQHFQQQSQQLLQQQHPIDDPQASYRVPHLYVSSLPPIPPLPPSPPPLPPPTQPPGDSVDQPMQSTYLIPPDHQVRPSQDIMINTIASSTATAVATAASATPPTTTLTGCCNCSMNSNNLHPVETQFNHHHDNNSQITQPLSSNFQQASDSQPTSPQLHLMTPPHHVSNAVKSGPDNGAGRDNLIDWNSELYGQPASTEAELRSRLDKLEFLDSEKQVIDETIEATRFIFESNDNQKVCNFLNDIVIFCDAALRRLIKVVKQIKAFRMLNMDDQIMLLKTACFKILLLRSTYHFSNEFGGWIDHKTGKVMTLDILKRAKKSLVYERHRDLVQTMPEPLRKDRFIMSILAMTLLFDPASNLKHTNSVALDNLIYLNLLRKYLMSTQPDPLNKYETLITVLQVIKACNEEYNNFFSKDFQPEQITPLLVEIFDISTVHCDSQSGRSWKDGYDS